MPAMTLKDLNQVQTLFSEAGLDYKIELEDGRLSIVGPSDIVSSEISSRLIADGVTTLSKPLAEAG
jgi:hypothetical protein